MSGPTILLVHGAFCGAWAYWRLGPELDRLGLAWVGADLPTCGAPDASIGPLDDVRHVRELLDGIDGPVVALGKSYGGTVISGATVDAPNVAHLVYVAAMMPKAGDALQGITAAAMTPGFAAGLGFTDAGLLTMDPEVGAACGFSQASTEDQDVWRREGRPMSMGSDPSLALERVGWEHIPSTYVVCTEDRAIQPDVQRAWAAQATHAVERPWDHSPGVSHPAEVAELLAEVVASL